jgi:cAMP-specific phosphodiesterase 4
MANSDPNIETTLTVSANIELAILIIFVIEILCKIFVFGWKNYFKDPWMIFDALVILISVILLILDSNMNDSNFKTVSKVLRGIFRFLRLFLVFRKFNQVKRISNTS